MIEWLLIGTGITVLLAVTVVVLFEIKGRRNRPATQSSGNQQSQYSENELRRQTDLYMEANKAAVDLGTLALKTVILINGGAVAAALAFLGQLWPDRADLEIIQAIGVAIGLFAIGVASGALAAGLAYFIEFFRSNTVAYIVRAVVESRSAENEGRNSIFIRNCLLYPAMILTAGAYIAFVLGTYQAVDGISKLRPPQRYVPPVIEQPLRKRLFLGHPSYMNIE